MKKMLLGALVAGTMVLPLTNAEAYHVIKQHRTAQPVVESQAAVTPAQPVVAARNEGLSATASAHTDRSLVSEEAPASVRLDKGTATAPVAAAKGGYLMRSGDQLQIVVYGHEDLSTRPGVSYTPYVVRPDGMLAMPLIGDVNCQNRTVPEVTQEITNRLAEYIIDPQVTINITKLGTTRVYVLGEVNRQGFYELEKSHNLLDAVAAAAGFTQKAAKTKVYVVRKDQKNIALKVDMKDLLRKGATNVNIELNEGDSVYISSNHKIGLQAILTGVYNITNSWEKVDDIRKD